MLGYIVPIENQDLTNAAQDILVLNPGAATPVELRAFRLYSNVTTDVFARLQWLLRSTSGSGGGTAIVPRAVDQTNTRAAAVVATPVVTTPGTIVTASERDTFLWNMRYPLEVILTPEEYLRVIPTSRLCLALLAADLSSTRKIGGSFKVWE